MPHLHPTAIVDRNAQLADDVTVGPFSIIGPSVVIEAGTSVGAHCVIEGATTIGRRNRIFHHVTLGQEPQDLKFRGENATLRIGDHNDIREFTTMHIGTENGGGSTSVGSYNLLMVNTHIAHDSHVGDHCVLANNVMLAGHIIVQDHAVISGGAGLQHFVTVGRHAFIGGLAGVVHDCPPFMMTDSHPAHVRGVNAVGLARHKFEPETIKNLERAYMLLFSKKARSGNGSFAAGLEEAQATLGHDEYVTELIDFCRRSAAAPAGRAEEAARPDDKRATPTR